MLNNKKNKKTIEISLEANLMKEPMSALFFLTLIGVDSWFFWPELKPQAKSLNDFFYFQISLFDFFCGLCPLDFVFFLCFWSEKTNCGGQKLIIIGLCPPQFVFSDQKHKKKQNPGDTSHKKNQISLFEN